VHWPLKWFRPDRKSDRLREQVDAALAPVGEAEMAQTVCGCKRLLYG
jgi:hypothetical protein